MSLYVESGIRHSARSVAFSSDGRLVAASGLDRTVKLWDLESGRELTTLPNDSMAVRLAFLPGTSLLAAANEDGRIRIWDFSQGVERLSVVCSARASSALGVDGSGALLCGDEAAKVVRRWNSRTLAELPSRPAPALGLSDWRFVAEARLVLAADAEGRSHLLDLGTGRQVEWLSPADARDIADVALVPSRGRLATVDRAGKALLWSWRPGDPAPPRLLRSEAPDGVHAVAFSPDGEEVAYATEAGDVLVLRAGDGSLLRRLGSHGNRVENAGLADGSRTLAIQMWYDTPLAFDLASGQLGEVPSPALSYDNAGSFPSDGSLFGRSFTVRKRDDRVEVASAEGAPLLTMVMLDKLKGWVAVSPDGRFDTNLNLSEIVGVHWALAGRPLEPLPLEILLRDYYEPRLSAKVLGGAALPPLPPLETINRVQPRVRILGAREGGAAGLAMVTVEAQGQEDSRQPVGRRLSGVCDVRLFRNGQLVGRWPDPVDAGQIGLDAWRGRSCVGEKVVHDFPVALPSATDGSPVVLSAYAFNLDRVKSQTAVLSPGTLPAPRRVPRAYVISIGVDRYESQARNLNYAARDARVLAGGLVSLPGYEVHQLLLTSTGRDRGRWRATKPRIRAALARLAGPRDPAGSAPDAAGFRPATPDDLVILTFSGHGHTAPGGGFYLLASDSGTSTQVTPAALERFISTAELTEWLAAIDAGRMVVIIDACHSAGAVEQPGFKPGPLGDRGLGQLAYDKGMRILAASRADSAAHESFELRQGLLTYALVHDGLARDVGGHLRADADRDGRLSFGEWLRFGAARTPELYQDLRAGPTVGAPLQLTKPRDPILSGEPARSLAPDPQTPVLFDYQRDGRDASLRVVPPATPGPPARMAR